MRLDKDKYGTLVLERGDEDALVNVGEAAFVEVVKNRIIKGKISDDLETAKAIAHKANIELKDSQGNSLL